jgi:hypothetical protein
MNVFEKIKQRLQEKYKEYSKIRVDYAEGLRDGYIGAMTIVSEVEAEYGNRWIPCSERLPEKDGRYITTNMYEGEKEEVFDLWYEDGNWFIDAGEDETIRTVIAWMPLPEPYKPIG